MEYFRTIVSTILKKIQLYYRTPFIRICTIFLIFLVCISIGLLIFEKLESIFEALWLGIVTISTTGYGDIVPKTTEGKIITIVTMIFGVIITALLTGTVTSLFFNKIQKIKRGNMSYKRLKKTFNYMWLEN